MLSRVTSVPRSSENVEAIGPGRRNWRYRLGSCRHPERRSETPGEFCAAAAGTQSHRNGLLKWGGLACPESLATSASSVLVFHPPHSRSSRSFQVTFP